MNSSGSKRPYQNELRSRYSYLRRYLPAFLDLPFQAEPGAEPLMRGIQLLQEMNQDSARPLPQEIPISGIVPSGWQSSLEKEDGTIDRRLWEISPVSYTHLTLPTNREV